MKLSIRTFFVFLAALLCAHLFLYPAGEADAKEELKKAPPFPKKGIWLNQNALPKNPYKGKLTLVYFWDYTSVNCIREVGVLKKWHEMYSPFGLQMIWVHAPEYQIAFDEANVRSALEHMNIPFPLFLDNEFEVWEAFENRSWPTKHLVNESGQIIHTQVGEGGYMETEYQIRHAIQMSSLKVMLPERFIREQIEKFSTDRCGFMTTETYIGYKRASWWGGEVANERWMEPDETMMFKDRGSRVQRGYFVQGLWTNREDDLMHARETAGYEDYLGMIYVANEVYLVASNAVHVDEPPVVYVTRDGEPLGQDHQGQDIKVDENGKTYFTLAQARLYYLIQNDDQEPHEIKLHTNNYGVSFHSFSFSNNCLSEFEHL